VVSTNLIIQTTRNAVRTAVPIAVGLPKVEPTIQITVAEKPELAELILSRN
jgi:hypothetical protein